MMNPIYLQKTIYACCFFLIPWISMAVPIHEMSPLKKAIATDVKQIKIPPLPALDLPKATQVELDNGMVLFLQPDHEIPEIDVYVWIQVGSYHEPFRQAGLTELFERAWIQGGTSKSTGEQITEWMEEHAVSLRSGFGNNFTYIRLNTLTSEFNQAIEMFSDLVQHPEFRQKIIELEKQKMKTHVLQRNDNIYDIVSREKNKLVYGAKHPSFYEPELFTINALKREDLKKWHQTFFTSSNIMIGVSGDFEIEPMKAKLNSLFGRMKKGPADQIPQFEIQPAKPGIYVVNKNDVAQSQIRFIQLGQSMKSPDYYALCVMNRILGEGATSRLFRQIRTKKGLAYAIGGGVGLNWNEPGIFEISLGTSNQTVKQAIDAVYTEVQRMIDEPPTIEEVEEAKKALLHSEVFRYDSLAQVMYNQMLLKLFHYPPDFYEKYPEEIQKVTVADVQRVVKKYINLSKFSLLVVGKESEFDAPLTSLGPVNYLDITIPRSSKRGK